MHGRRRAIALPDFERNKSKASIGFELLLTCPPGFSDLHTALTFFYDGTSLDAGNFSLISSDKKVSSNVISYQKSDGIEES